MVTVLAFMLGSVTTFFIMKETMKLVHKSEQPPVKELTYGQPKEDIVRPMGVQEFAAATKEQLQSQNEILKEWLFGEEGVENE